MEKIRGNGVRCRVDINMNDIICEYDGDLMSASQGRERDQQYKNAGDEVVGNYQLYFQFDSLQWW